MAGRCEGLSDLAWPRFVDLFPPEPPRRGRGMPPGPFRKGVNPLLSVLSTGCRWGDVPQGPPWASKRAAHRWLRRWHEEGTLATMHARMLGLAEDRGMRNWQDGAVDGAVSLWHRRR